MQTKRYSDPMPMRFFFLGCFSLGQRTRVGTDLPSSPAKNGQRTEQRLELAVGAEEARERHKVKTDVGKQTKDGNEAI